MFFVVVGCCWLLVVVGCCWLLGRDSLVVGKKLTKNKEQRTNNHQQSTKNKEQRTINNQQSTRNN